MAALGVPTDYIEYMMGHTISTYHDVQMKGIDFLRNIYASSGLSIRPHTQWSKLDQVKAFMKSLGLNPEELLVRDAMSKPHRTIMDSEQNEQEQFQILGQALKNAILNGLK